MLITSCYNEPDLILAFFNFGKIFPKHSFCINFKATNQQSCDLSLASTEIISMYCIVSIIKGFLSAKFKIFSQEFVNKIPEFGPLEIESIIAFCIFLLSLTSNSQNN